MYCLIVQGHGWSGRRDTMDISRLFEFTEEHIQEMYTKDGLPAYDVAAKYPVIFMSEDRWDDKDPLANVGEITSIKLSGSKLTITYRYDPLVPPLRNSKLRELAADLDIEDFEFNRTHWALKDVDLFKVLYEHASYQRHQPRVFKLQEPESIEEDLVSVMMPFDRSFDEVYAAIGESAEAAGLRCLRADDIWENPAIIQDVVSLVDRSRIVICDCTRRNPNVFYEMGIAHTLGREVIPITQSETDIPFDVSHLRYVRYLNNAQGHRDLSAQLSRRFNSLS